MSAERSDAEELIVAAGADEFGLRLNRQRLGMYPLNASICETLVRLTPDFQVEPWLATSWTYVGDNTYRFFLRRGVHFHDGSPFNALAVKYSIDLSVAAKTQYSFLSANSVSVIDDSTVDIRPSLPNLRILEQLVHPTYAAVARGSDPAVRPVCTGPFKFKEYVPLRHLSVERNERYWGPRAKLQQLTFRFIPDENTRALALRSGEVDAIFDVGRNMVAGLKATKGIHIVNSVPGSTLLIYMATRGLPPHDYLRDPLVRKAVAMAIDRSVLVDRVLDGYATRVSTVNPPKVLGPYAAVVRGAPYDPRGAERLLDSAGWTRAARGGREKNGRPLELVMIVQSGPVDPAIAEYVQAQLRAVGVGMRIDRLDAAGFDSRINRGEFDLDIELPNQNDANPAFLLSVRWYQASNVRSARFMLAGRRFDSLVTGALSSPDHGQTQRLAAEAMHVLLDEEVGAIPLAGIYRIYAMTEGVRGFAAHPSRLNQRWDTVWLER
ncbi:MAG: ABC transporter substrate-binding protein [Gemmatimonadaceae bacterium]